MARVLGRLRISRDTEASTAIERQRERIEQWAVMMGHVIVGWAVDENVSRSVSPFETPGFGPWLDERAGEWDIVVAWKLDRLGSGLRHMTELFAFCEDNNKALVCIEDGVDISTSIGKFIAGVLSLIAEMERENVKARVADQRKAARKNGKYTGLSYPYGYRPVKSSGKGWEIETHPEHADIVREIFEMVTEQSVSSVCRVLNDRGTPAPKGGEWIPSTIIQMVRSRSSVGYVEHNGQLVIGDDGNPVRREPLVSDALQHKAVQALAQGRRPTNRKFETALLSGIVVCGKCGEGLHVARTEAKGGKCDHAKDGQECPEDSDGCKGGRKIHRYSYYKCSGTAGKPGSKRARCNASNVRMEDMDTIGERLVLGDIGHTRRMERVRVSGGDQRVIADLTQQIKDLTAAMAATDDDDDDLAEQISALKARRKAARSVGDVWDVRPIEDGRGATWGEYWATLESVQDKRNLMAELGAELSALRTGKGVDVGFKLLDRHQTEGTLIVAASKE